MIGTWLMLVLLTAQSPAKIARVSATASRITFDPEHPQSYVPKLNKGESAITVCRFDCRPTFTHEVTSTAQRDGQTEITLKLTSVHVSLAMENLIYLPTNVRPPLRVHEEGHRVINERIYDEEAERIAREVAASVMSKTWVARGADRETAEQTALTSAVGELCTEYRARIAPRVAQVSDKFDELTKHGANDASVVDAIDQAFAACASK
jgi:hypothetical protein